MGEAVQCHFSVILYEATEEGWKGGGEHSRGELSKAHLWFLCFSVA